MYNRLVRSSELVVGSKQKDKISTNYELQAKRTHNQLGQSLMELVVVIAVVVIVIGALTFATIASLRNAQFSKNQAQATKLAQEGLEWVRTGRDRNACINDTGSADVYSWNGNSSYANCPDPGAIWDYRISGPIEASNCDYKSTIAPATSKQCYLKISSDGSLRYLISSTTFPTDYAEAIPPSPAVAIFKRAITLSDDDSYTVQKTVTAIVTWTDFSGPHESRLTTILRKI